VVCFLLNDFKKAINIKLFFIKYTLKVAEKFGINGTLADPLDIR